MKNISKLSIVNLPNVLIVLLAFLVMNTGNAYAHCDTLDGPVVADARQALQAGDVTPILEWVSEGEEDAIKAVYTHTLAVRQLGDEAKTWPIPIFLKPWSASIGRARVHLIQV